MILIQLLLSFIAVFSFSVMFCAPRSQYVFCGLCGCLSQGVYRLLEAFGANDMICILFSTFSLTILTRILSILRRTPVTIYLVPGVLPLVPGAKIYYTSYYLMMNEAKNAMFMGLDAFKTAGAISLGIIFGLTIPMQRFQTYVSSKSNDCRHNK
ncbi:MAG: threonine/serine exporter [Lachnospiraceae bacterium]|jgi:uncharacterized membrane protein YjjB (DUF3815 family)|nr:threonine/serine exporter [Lachnospiraceae bacterium]